MYSRRQPHTRLTVHLQLTLLMRFRTMPLGIEGSFSSFFSETAVTNFVLQIYNFTFVISKNEFTYVPPRTGFSIPFILHSKNFLLEYFYNTWYTYICRSNEFRARSLKNCMCLFIDLHGSTFRFVSHFRSAKIDNEFKYRFQKGRQHCSCKSRTLPKFDRTCAHFFLNYGSIQLISNCTSIKKNIFP